MELFDQIDNPELAARDRGMEVAAATNAKLLNWLRSQMRELYLYRKVKLKVAEPFVTPDEARIIVELAFAQGQFERPSSMNFMGSVFKGRGWKPTGDWIRSKTAGRRKPLTRKVQHGQRDEVPKEAAQRRQQQRSPERRYVARRSEEDSGARDERASGKSSGKYSK